MMQIQTDFGMSKVCICRSWRRCQVSCNQIGSMNTGRCTALGHVAVQLMLPTTRSLAASEPRKQAFMGDQLDHRQPHSLQGHATRAQDIQTFVTLPLSYRKWHKRSTMIGRRDEKLSTSSSYLAVSPRRLRSMWRYDSAADTAWT